MLTLFRLRAVVPWLVYRFAPEVICPTRLGKNTVSRLERVCVG
jgi:hypothetical protein